MSKQSSELLYSAIIITPFQYICLLEYLYKKNIPKSNCDLILISHSEILVNQIINYDGCNGFRTVSKPMIGCVDIWLRQWSTYKVLFSNRSKIPIIGNLNNSWCVYAIQNKKGAEDAVVLDDGAASILLIKKRKKKDFKLRKIGWLGKMALFYRLILRNKTFYKERVNFFTIFNFPNDSGYDITENNEFAFLKSNSESAINNEIWFIATPFFNFNLMTKAGYKLYVQKTVDFAKSNNLKVKYFKAKLGEELEYDDVEMIDNVQPFELTYIESKIKPKFVVGFHTTILFSLAKMDAPSHLVSLRINEKGRLGDSWNNVDLIYDFMEKSDNIKVIDADDFAKSNFCYAK